MELVVTNGCDWQDPSCAPCFKCCGHEMAIEDNAALKKQKGKKS
jgi:hypothetical protein